ncbi:hypothetical protein E1262_10950 [Jiangella aurantiaca]|uniref:DUF4267 domain-containing protein n=1 Tax=Jiangella aurantiaca TaxID=2530373 RepID=A0A4R5ACE1_9ACTN|nr:hypothetical protein [Jiangella aurantiaca]TDD70073.1 hypothetical protein E1262_10950 [Jiangella aurantiaca]
MELPRTVRVAAVAAVLSGLPSTAYAAVTGGDVLASTRAAGTLLPGRRSRPSVAGGVVAHVVVSAGWTAVLFAVARRRPLGVAGGLAAGAAIAALDLELIGRRYPAIRTLPRGPQWLDHLAFGAVVGAFSADSGESPQARDRR